MSRSRFAGAVLGVLFAGAASAQPAPFHAYLLPPSSAIDVGETASVRFEVDETAREFNGYEITIQYDPAIVAFLPPVIEGQLMIGACGNTFKYLTRTDSSLTYAHVILCAGVALNGPGVLSTYRFRGLANGVSPITITTNPDRAFVNAGIYINPNHPTFPRQVIFHHAEIRVGPQAGIDSGAIPPVRLRLEQNAPNPFSAVTTFGFEIGAPGPVTLEVFDAAGRRVWAAARTLGTGRHQIPWRGFDFGATPLASGAYFYRLTTPEGSASRKLNLVR